MKAAVFFLALFFCCACGSPENTKSSPAKDTPPARNDSPAADLPGKDTVKTDRRQAGLDTAAMKALANLLDTLVGKRVGKKYTYRRTVFSAREKTVYCDAAGLCSNDLLCSGYLQSTRYAYSIPGNSAYDLIVYEHRYSDIAAADSMMSRIRTLAAIDVLLYKCALEYYRIGTSVYTTTINCPIAHFEKKLMGHLQKQWRKLSGSRDSILTKDVPPNSDYFSKGTVKKNPQRIIGHWKPEFVAVLTEPGEYDLCFGQYDEEKVKAFQQSVIKIRTDSFELEGKLFPANPWYKEIPTAYRYFDRRFSTIRRENGQQKAIPGLPAQLLNLKGPLLEHHFDNTGLTYFERGKLVVTELPNGRLLVIQHGCAFYLRKV